MAGSGSDVLFDKLAERNGVGGFKQVMSRFPTGVAIVASSYAGKPHGMAVNSLTSVSLDPLLVLFCVARASTTWPFLRAARRFAVSVLGVDQETVCRTFATKGVDRFSSVAWSHNDSGQPVLDDAIAWLDCRVEGIVPAGDHDVVVGRVVEAHDRPDGMPLVYHRSGFGGLHHGMCTHTPFTSV